MSSQPAKLVYFYSKADRKMIEPMMTQLKILQNSNIVKIWSPQTSQFGGDKRQEFIEEVRHAEIVLYFLSPNFIAGDDFRELTEGVQIEPGKSARDWLLEKQREKRLLLIPILIHNIAGFDNYEESNFTVPSKNDPLGCYESFERKNEFWEIAEKIRRHVDKTETPGRQPFSHARKDRKIPDPAYTLLPHLCARDQQYDELKQVLNIFQNMDAPDKTKKPFVFIIHGRTDECPEGFKARLEQRDIYGLLKINYEVPIKIYNLSFPHNLVDLQQPQSYFDRTLKQTVFETSEYAADDNPFSFLSQFETVIFNYKVFSENWSRRIMSLFFKFWNDISIGNNQTTIIVNLIFSYDENNASMQENNLNARKFFGELEGQSLDFPNISISVTPELEAIQIAEVDGWLKNINVFRDFCLRHNPKFCDTLAAENEIKLLYGNQKTPLRFEEEVKLCFEGEIEIMKVTRIRMLTLSDRLSKLLKDKRCSQRQNF